MTMKAQSIASLEKFILPAFARGKFKVQYTEQLVIELDNALGREQTHILNQSLSVDSGQPISGLVLSITSLYQFGAPVSISFE